MEHQLELHALLVSSAKELGLTIEEVKAEQFLRYLAQLIEWNRVINLTAILDPDEIIIKHFIDSLTVLVTIEFLENSLVLDVGSGGGFPGIPIKIMRPDVSLVLVEPIQKKCSFLNSMIGLLKLENAATFNGTIEEYAKWPLWRPVDAVVIRALKYKEILIHLPALLAPNGKVILYRTEPVINEEIGENFHLVDEKTLVLPQGSGRRVISVIQKNTQRFSC